MLTASWRRVGHKGCKATQRIVNHLRKEHRPKRKGEWRINNPQMSVCRAVSGAWPAPGLLMGGNAPGGGGVGTHSALCGAVPGHVWRLDRQSLTRWWMRMGQQTWGVGEFQWWSRQLTVMLKTPSMNLYPIKSWKVIAIVTIVQRGTQWSHVRKLCVPTQEDFGVVL